MPRSPAAVGFAEQGILTGASGRNWAAYGQDIDFAGHLPATERTLMTDPQTSGGLLVSCRPEDADAVLQIFTRHGCSARGRCRSDDAGSSRSQCSLIARLGELR